MGNNTASSKSSKQASEPAAPPVPVVAVSESDSMPAGDPIQKNDEETGAGQSLSSRGTSARADGDNESL